MKKNKRFENLSFLSVFACDWDLVRGLVGRR